MNAKCAWQDCFHAEGDSLPYFDANVDCLVPQSYLAQRLLTDDSERMRSILRKFFYSGPSGTLNMEYVEGMLVGVASFATTFNISNGSASDNRSLSVHLLKLFLSSESTYVQELFARELVRGADAASRTLGATAMRRLTGPVSSMTKPVEEALETLPEGALRNRVRFVLGALNVATDPDRFLLTEEDENSIGFFQKVWCMQCRRYGHWLLKGEEQVSWAFH